MKKAVIFDLDGTLLDTIEDMAACMNEALKKHNQPPFSIGEYKNFVGWGAKALALNVIEALHTKLDADELVMEFKKLYEHGLNNHTKPYEGICDLLQELSVRGYSLGVLSNKPHDLTQIYIKHFFKDYNFTQVFGQQEGIPTKPNPQVALQIAKNFTLTCKECFFVGDTKVDMQTAKNASMNAIGVSWGFRDVKELQENGADFIAYQPKDIANIVAKELPLQ